MAYSIDHFPGRELFIKGKAYKYFGGTSYLGIQTDLEFQKLFLQNVKKYGSNYGASRISNVRLSIYEEAEKQLADWVGSPASLCLSSGYLAGKLLSSFFSSTKYRLFYAPNCHSALYSTSIDQKAVKPHITYASLNLALRQHLDLHPLITPVVFMDTIDFSGYNYPNFEGLASLPLSQIVVVADDSHGIGILGDNGEGAYQKLLQLKPKEFLLCCSLGKALGLQAGAIFASKKRIEELSRTNLFGGASPPAPAYLATLVSAWKIYKRRRELLQDNLKFFLNALPAAHGLRQTENHPAFAFKNPATTSHLKKSGVIITDFNYPSENSETSSRIVISAAHLKSDLQFLANLFVLK